MKCKTYQLITGFPWLENDWTCVCVTRETPSHVVNGSVNIVCIDGWFFVKTLQKRTPLVIWLLSVWNFVSELFALIRKEQHFKRSELKYPGNLRGPPKAILYGLIKLLWHRCLRIFSSHVSMTRRMIDCIHHVVWHCLMSFLRQWSIFCILNTAGRGFFRDFDGGCVYFCMPHAEGVICYRAGSPIGPG